MKKVLIITYYWPPSGGGGVMRWLKMSKYLPEFGWQPIIYTPLNPDASVVDESLKNEVHPDIAEINTPIWEPYELYRKLTGKKKGSKFKAGYISEASSGNWKSKISVYIRGNLLVPDPRMFWINPSIKFLTKYLKENHVDAVISTGPPHSMHLIGLGIKKRYPEQKWIADFRDPWTNIDFYSKLRLTGWADKRHKKLEQDVLKYADRVVTVSPSWQEDFKNLGSRNIDLVYNGFDHEDFENLEKKTDEQFSITHFGAFNKDRNPHSFWEALKQISLENPEFRKQLKLQLIGQTDNTVIEAIKENGLSENLKLIEHLPHSKGIKLLKQSQLLLLPINNANNAMGILPGKMYEYLALQRPIVAIGPTNADFAKIITQTQSGVCLNFGDIKGLKAAIEEYFALYQKGELQINSGSFDIFSRKNQAKAFVNILNAEA